LSTRDSSEFLAISVVAAARSWVASKQADGSTGDRRASNHAGEFDAFTDVFSAIDLHKLSGGNGCREFG
jgi:hypothetical protein